MLHPRDTEEPGGLPLLELDEDIDITVVVEIGSDGGTEERQLSNVPTGAELREPLLVQLDTGVHGRPQQLKESRTINGCRPRECDRLRPRITRRIPHVTRRPSRSTASTNAVCMVAAEQDRPLDVVRMLG